MTNDWSDGAPSWDRLVDEAMSGGYRPGERLERLDTDELVFAGVDLGGALACVIFPPRWASDELVTTLSRWAEAVVGGICPTCRSSTFEPVPDGRAMFGDLPVSPPGVDGVGFAMAHRDGCATSERAMTEQLLNESERYTRVHRPGTTRPPQRESDGT